MKVSLTHEGLSRLGIDQDFELVTDGEESTVKCSRSQISFISPVISKLFMIDPTIKEFKLTTEHSYECAEIIRSLLNGNSPTITRDLTETFYLIMLELGNEEILPNIEEDLSTINVIEILHAKHLKSMNIEREIEFIASHFYLFKQKDISPLDISTIDNILSSKSLVVMDEKTLFNFIFDLIREHDCEYRFLYSHLHLEYLNIEDVTIIIDSINEDNVGHFLQCIFRRLLNSTPLAVKDSDITRFRNIHEPIFEKRYESDDELPIELDALFDF